MMADSLTTHCARENYRNSEAPVAVEDIDTLSAKRARRDNLSAVFAAGDPAIMSGGFDGAGDAPGDLLVEDARDDVFLA